jgi:hypothetical protein
MPDPRRDALLQLLASHKPEVTALSPVDEARFRQWAQQNGITDVDQPDSKYDYRGYWQANGNQPIRFGVDHFTDTFKQHGHPTFSVESQYSRGLHDGGRWLTEDVQVQPPMPSHAPASELLKLLGRVPVK